MQIMFWEVCEEPNSQNLSSKTICMNHVDVKHAIRLKLSNNKKVIVTRVCHDYISITNEELNLIDEYWPDEENSNNEKYTRSDTWPFVKRNI